MQNIKLSIIRYNRIITWSERAERLLLHTYSVISEHHNLKG